MIHDVPANLLGRFLIACGLSHDFDARRDDPFTPELPGIGKSPRLSKGSPQLFPFVSFVDIFFTFQFLFHPDVLPFGIFRAPEINRTLHTIHPDSVWPIVVLSNSRDSQVIKMKSCSAALCLAALLFLSLAQPGSALRAQTSSGAAANPAAVPSDRLSEAWWAQRHQAILQQNASHSNAELLLVGGSTFSNFDKTEPPDENFQPVWNQFYAPRHALNLGFSGDTTSNVLWRIDNGELDGLDPRVVVVLVGGANTALENQTAAQTVDGIDAVVGDIARRLPMAHIVLLGILPDGVSAAITARDQEINARLGSLFTGNRNVLYLDVGAIFYQRGSLNASLFLHTPREGIPLQPNIIGQRRLAEAIEPALSNLLRDSLRSASLSPADIAQQLAAQR
jgi:lysophospholipase L1-like esterase